MYYYYARIKSVCVITRTPFRLRHGRAVFFVFVKSLLCVTCDDLRFYEDHIQQPAYSVAQKWQHLVCTTSYPEQPSFDALPSRPPQDETIDLSRLA